MRKEELEKYHKIVMKKHKRMNIDKWVQLISTEFGVDADKVLKAYGNVARKGMYPSHPDFIGGIYDGIKTAGDGRVKRTKELLTIARELLDGKGC